MVCCATCRVIREVPWRLLPGLRLGDPIEGLQGRLRCEQCGQRPAQVEPSAREDAPGYAKHYRH